MSKQTEKQKQGQRAGELKLHHSELTANEKKLVGVLAQPGRPVLTIKELMHACKWDKRLGKARGNSRVRNTLRRLVRAKWVGHPETVGDGRYRLTKEAASRLRRLKPAKRTVKKKTAAPEPQKATG